MTFFTSINNFYLAKARVLAKSLKYYMPDAPFILILSDKIPDGFILEKEPFDEVITIEELEIPVENLNMWIYMHSVVELCTAVKGQALFNLLERYDKVVYLDPDIVVYNDLCIIDELLEKYDIIFTPHQTIPEENDMDIFNNEICCLKNGTYNFGFFAVKANNNGKFYAKWYRDRLIKYCKDDRANGLFTDQKWGDIAPALFENLLIWKDPGANVSTWNLTHRNITKENDKYYVNGKPMLFYHFSGFDSGNQLIMLNLYSKGNPVLYELRNLYIKELNINGQNINENSSCFYDLYLDGSTITSEERNLLRNRLDVQEYFSKANPYDKDGNSYYLWFQNEVKIHNKIFQTKTKEEIFNELNIVYNSRSWRLTKPLRKLGKIIRYNKFYLFVKNILKI